MHNSTITIHNSISESVLENLVQNQEQMSKLMEIQNKLIESLLKK